MSEWKEYKLGEIAEIVGGGTPTTSNPEYWGGDIPWLSPKDLTGYKKIYISHGERNITESGLMNSSAKMMPKGTVLFSSRAPIGYVAIAKNPVCTNQGFKSFVCRQDKVLNLFLYYWLKNNVEYFQSLGTGTTFAEISGSAMRDIEISLPPINVQKRIAGVLSSLDDKIDLLNRENATLEALAETLFRHYFIENPNPAWKEGKVSDVAIHCKESINPQKHFDEIFLHYSIPAYDNGKRPIEEQGQSIQSNKYVIPQNCILFSKLNPHKDKRVWLMLDDVQPNAICSTEFQIVKPQNDQWLYFLYEWLTYKENYDEIASGVSGTSGSHQRIDPKVIFENGCPIVDEFTLKQYNTKVKPIFEKIKSNQQRIQTLVIQRDMLLPRLMSGEVKIIEQ